MEYKNSGTTEFTLKIDENPKLCKNNCGFYVSNSTDYCSVCMKNIKSIEPINKAKPVIDIVKITKKKQKNKKRCYTCRKKLGFYGHDCKCGFKFCDEHRYAEEHKCDFNYSNKTYLEKTLIDAKFVKVNKI